MVRKIPHKESVVIKQSADDALIYAENIIDTVHEPLVALDQDLRVVKVNRSFYETFKVKPEETVGQHIFDLGNKQLDIPRLRKLLESILPQTSTFDDYEIEYDFPTIGRRTLLLNARQIQRAVGKDQVILLAIEDITERRQAENALAEKAYEVLSASEGEYRALVENINEVLYTLDIQGNITYVSPAVERFTSYKVGDLIGKPFTSIIYPDDLPAVLDSYNRLMNGQLEPLEYRVLDKDGQIIFVCSSSQPIYKDGQIEGVTGLITDITDRKKIEEELWESELRYHELVNNSKNGVAIYEAAADCEDFIFKDLNRAAESIDNIKKEDIIGKSILQIFPGIREFGLFGVLQRVWRTGVPESHPISRYHDERISGWRDNYVYRLSSGEIVVIYEDVTMRKEAEELLRSKQLMLARTEGIANIGSWEWDIATDTVTWSDELFRIFQRDPQAGAPSFAEHPAFYHPDDMARLRQAVEAAVADGTPYELELRAIRKDGETRVCVARGVAEMSQGGRPVHLVGSLQDITERRLSNEKLLKSYESLKKTLNDAINTMVKIMETRDPYTAGHQQSVARLATAIAREMKLEDTRIENLRTAAVIHDIGKMYIPSDILSKPGKLADIEFSLIKTHAQSGYDIVKGMDFPCNVAKTILQHHERLDGSGYPNQLKGEDTLLEAKILAVADVIEAMTSNRPYRPALGIDKALEEISKNRGRLYDPDVVDTSLEIFKSGKFEFKPV